MEYVTHETLNSYINDSQQIQKDMLSSLRVVMPVTVTEAVNDDVHIFQISGFHFRARR